MAQKFDFLKILDFSAFLRDIGQVAFSALSDVILR
jgi:hypothetical protein